MTRRCPKFEPGFAGAEGYGAPEDATSLGKAVAAQPEGLGAGVPNDASSEGVGCRRVSNLVAIRRRQNRFLNHERHNFTVIILIYSLCHLI